MIWPMLHGLEEQAPGLEVVPAGVNIVTGARDELARVLAEDAESDAVWYVGTAEGSRMVEAASVTNLRRTFLNHGLARDWLDASQGEGREFLRRAAQVNNIWVPYGE